MLFSQRRIVSSFEPEAMRLPFGEKATSMTGPFDGEKSEEGNNSMSHKFVWSLGLLDLLSLLA